MEFLEDVPDILYKYREWNNPYSKNLLFKRQLFFSSPQRFNDPFDGGILFQYDPKDLTEEKIFLKHYEVVKHIHPDLSEGEIHQNLLRTAT